MKHIILYAVISSLIYYNMYKVIVGFNLSSLTVKVIINAYIIKGNIASIIILE